MSSVTIRQLQKSFGAVQAVRDFTLDIPDGAFVTLLGPSGCGKTTTLNMLAGLETPDAGSVHVDDIDVTGHAPHERGMAMVFQSYALYPHKNVFGNLAFSLQLAKVPRAEIEQRVRRVAEMLEIGDLLDRRVGALSGGQQQRVSLARALVKEPLVFLFDEPLSNLDAALRIRTRNEIKRLHQRLRTTSVFVTHDQEEAMVLSDLIAVMEKGAIDQVGSPDEIYHRPANVRVAQFVGKPRINLLDVDVIRAGDAGIELTTDGFTLASTRAVMRLADEPPDRLTMGIRSEDVEVARRAPSAPVDQPSIRGRVTLVEPLGPDTFVEVEVASQTVTVRVDPRLRPIVDELVDVNIQADRIHLFDPATGARVNG